MPFEGVLNACGVAYSQCAANVQPLRDGATVKRFHAGFAARNGVVSATLARHGLTGARHWLEGEFGYYNLYERGEYDPAPLTEGLGRRYHLMELALKPWPSARDNHGIVDAALELAAEHDLKAEQIERIEAYLPPNAFRVSGKPWAEADGHPVVEAIVSGAYCVAAAIIRRGLYLDDFTEARIADPAVGALARRVNVQLFPGITSEIAFVPQRLVVYLKVGRVLDRRIDVMKGHPGKPMTRAEVVDKFRRCFGFAKRPTDNRRIDAILHAVDSLETLKETRELGTLLAL
jgi:2-methylcitrate dehydratase PrpD